MCQRRHPGVRAVGRRELHRDEEHLPEAIVVEALRVPDERPRAPLGGVAEAAREERSRGVARQLGGLGHRHVEDQLAAGLQRLPDTGQEALDVLPRVEVEEGVERADDEGEARVDARAPHVAAAQRDSTPHLVRLRAQAAAQVRQHGPGAIHARDLDAGAGHGDGDPPVAAAVLEHGPAAPGGERDVVAHVVQATAVCAGVVGGVFVVGGGARLELAIHEGARARPGSPTGGAPVRRTPWHRTPGSAGLTCRRRR